MKVLVVNCGSSSLKYQLIDMNDEKVLAKGNFERIGEQDPDLLSLVWNNLFSNAMKFTPEGGTVGLGLREEGDWVVVTVSDTGCGMKPETGKHIFEKFYQGDTSHATQGNGLGLALVKRVVDILGGEIGVRSVYGQGSTFTVKIRRG